MIAKNQNSIMGICENGMVKYCKIIIPEINEPVAGNHYLTFKSDTAFELSVAEPNWNGTLYISTNAQNWTEWDGTTVSSSNAGLLYMRGTGNGIIGGSSYSNSFSFDNASNLECSGNIEYLLDWETVSRGEHPVMNKYCYTGLFAYATALITPPQLPALRLTNFCYGKMFRNTSIKTLPELPATKLELNCYRNMFTACPNIKLSTEFSSVYSKQWRIPSEGVVTETGSNWNSFTFNSTGGTFTDNPEINTTYYLQEVE